MFGSALLQIMKAKNKTQDQVSKGSGIEQSTLARLISGERIPTYHQILYIANTLQVDPYVFFPTAEVAFIRDDKFPQHPLVYVNHRVGFTQTIYIDQQNQMGVYKTMFFEDIQNPNVIPPIQNYNGNIALRVYSVLRGMLTFYYEAGKIDIVPGNSYRIKGYEKGFKALAGTVVDTVLIGDGYDKFLDCIIQYAR